MGDVAGLAGARLCRNATPENPATFTHPNYFRLTLWSW
jgi:hypothetical protein